MRFYKINKEYEFEEEFFLFEIENFRAELGDVFSYSGEVYSICVINRIAHKAIVRKLDINLDNEETFMEDDIICPICGYKDLDSWETTCDDDEYICPYCGAELSVVVDYSVTYTTTVKKQPTIKVIE